MNKEFLKYYNIELQRLKDNGKQFAKSNPKIASKINLDQFSCIDPYVERLLEGYSYLSARVHQKIDSGYPKLSQALIDNIFPDYLNPIPSMGIIRFEPDLDEQHLLRGKTISAGTKLNSISANGFRQCRFTTAHNVTLWPFNITAASYLSDDMGRKGIRYNNKSKSCLSLEFKADKNINFSDLEIDDLDIHLRNSSGMFSQEIMELMLNSVTKVLVKSSGSIREFSNIGNKLINPVGFKRSEGLFPFNPKTFEGYRLIRKYFCLPQSFMFIRLKELRKLFREANNNNVEIIFIFDKEFKKLNETVKMGSFSLFCTPVANIFEKTLSRIHIDSSKSEYHAVGERTNPLDFEIIKVKSVKGFKKYDNVGQVFKPMYSSSNFFDKQSSAKSYYSINRAPRTISDHENEYGTRTAYAGTETYISIVDQDCAPFNGKILDIEIKAFCSNRDLPLLIPIGSSESDFKLNKELYSKSIKFINGPTHPHCMHIFNSLSGMINHTSLNYSSLEDKSGNKTGETIRNILGLYAISELHKGYINDLKKVRVVPCTNKYSRNGNITFLNGFDVELEFSDSDSANDFFLLGMILDKFFDQAAPVNSYTQTSLITDKRGKVVKWPMRHGTYQMI